MRDLPQIDDYVPAKYLRPMGALREFAARARFYLGYPQFLMIAVLFYYESTYIQTVFPTIWTWAAFLVVVGIGAMLFEYGIVYPAQIVFNRGQGERVERSPIYSQVRENGERLKALEEQLTGQRPLADGGAITLSGRPGCIDCGTQGCPGIHKNRPVWVCPDCETILLREVDA